MRDHAEIGGDTGSAATSTPTTMSLEFTDAQPRVEDIMTETIVSASPDESVSSVIQQMAQYRISCVIVTAGGRAVGILTERDVLRGVANRYQEFVHATVAEEMSRPVFSVPPETTALAASALMEARNIKRLLIARDQQPIGVVTQTDITRGLISMSPFRNIADLMSRDLVTASETTTMLEAAQRMAARNISCVVLMRDGKAVGIVTEKDILQRVAISGADPATTPVAEIMSFPVLTIPPTHSVMSASRMMDQMHIHRLLIGDPGDVRGIVTQTDIISAVREKLEQASRARLHHKSEMGQLVDAARKGVSSAADLVRSLADQQEPVSATSAVTATAWNGHLLETLESHLAEAQESLERLTQMV